MSNQRPITLSSQFKIAIGFLEGKNFYAASNSCLSIQKKLIHSKVKFPEAEKLLLRLQKKVMKKLSET